MAPIVGRLATSPFEAAVPTSPADHPTEAALCAFVLGKLPDPDDGAVERHLSDCPSCQARAAAATAADPLLSLVAAVGSRAGTGHTVAPAADATPSAFAHF